MQDAGICAGPEVCADPALMGWVGSPNGNVDQPGRCANGSAKQRRPGSAECSPGSVTPRVV
jgi:hypothetical protein